RRPRAALRSRAVYSVLITCINALVVSAGHRVRGIGGVRNSHRTAVTNAYRMKDQRNFSEAFASYNRENDRDDIALGEKERKQILDLFPRGAWPQMPLEKYALGQPGSENSFCGWLEYRSPHLGSISGGSAKKLVIYKRKSGGVGWYFDPTYNSVEQAWEKVREAFVRAFELAEAGEWTAIDQLKPIWAGPALRVKTLHVYFPDRVL